MSDIELWKKAGSEARDVVNLLYGPVKPEELHDVINKALNKSRSATSALEALQRLSAGVPEPKHGD